MGMRAAIDAKCRDCIYDPLAGGTWRAQVEACTATDCGLFPYRPRSRAGKTARARVEGRSPEDCAKNGSNPGTAAESDAGGWVPVAPAGEQRLEEV